MYFQVAILLILDVIWGGHLATFPWKSGSEHHIFSNIVFLWFLTPFLKQLCWENISPAMVFMPSMVMVQTYILIAFYHILEASSQDNSQKTAFKNTLEFQPSFSWKIVTFWWPSDTPKSWKIAPWTWSGLQMQPVSHNISNHLQKPSKIDPEIYKNNPESWIPIPKPLRSRGRRQGRSLNICRTPLGEQGVIWLWAQSYRILDSDKPSSAPAPV